MAKKLKKMVSKIAKKTLPKVETEKINPVRNPKNKPDNNIESSKKQFEVSNGVKRIKIRVIGIGGGGGNIISEIAQRIKIRFLFSPLIPISKL